MSLRAEFDVTSPDLILGPTLQAMPSVELTIERQYALDPARPITFCWARCSDRDRLEETLAGDQTVAEFQYIDRTPEQTLVRVRHSDTGVISAYRQWVTVGGQLLECRGTDGIWSFTMRFPDQEAFAQYYEFLEDNGVEFDLHRLAAGAEVETPQPASETLTESQREALVLAFEYGFFSVPRETELSAVAAAFNISEQAVSERLRRGQARVIEEYVLPNSTTLESLNQR
ncbi:helix-turn-helix domain-containing protein [Natronolimnobius baerhuensis]|uniref:Bacterio-opsin activator n=1 Tax=Natronolimnobius baerhuensis TaxID=253108 RepID=A0A202EBF6_9EURY|nr:helix-turn-helix domain-containing protein [Natronolimnobius baerhuensis]OVE85579.1 bacterio-opsin activator [Natronolimnobius baerhuensis]